jgi:hypothetical protein
MKLFLAFVLGFFILGCSSKKIVKQNPSYEVQKYNAQKEWKELK